MKFSLLIVVVLTISISEVITETVYCERFGHVDWALGRMYACFLDGSTTIYSEDFVVSSADSSVQALNLARNLQIMFLPNSVALAFPNLVILNAPYCSIKLLSHKNFKNLNKLRHLELYNNKIELINSDTFEDLSSLEYLTLHNNNIKKMNGAAFRGLSRLSTVWLQNNNCINKLYNNPTVFARLSREVDANCGFTEAKTKTEDSQNVSNVDQSTNVSKAKLTECLAEIATLNTTLKATEFAMSAQQTGNTAMMSAMMTQLASQWNATCIVRTEELSGIVQMKVEEINGLLDEQAKNRATIIAKTEEITLLKNRLETQSHN